MLQNKICMCDKKVSHRICDIESSREDADRKFTKTQQFDCLTLKAPIRTAAVDIYKYFFIVFQRK